MTSPEFSRAHVLSALRAHRALLQVSSYLIFPQPLIHPPPLHVSSGNSMSDSKLCPTLYGDADEMGGEGSATCIPGCFPPGEQCADVLPDSSCFVDGVKRDHCPYVHGDRQCSYPPTQLMQALEAHYFMLSHHMGNHKHNEMVKKHAPTDYPADTPCPTCCVAHFLSLPDATLLPRHHLTHPMTCPSQVVDLRSVVENLPNAVEGFFCLSSADASRRADLRKIRSDFLKEYHLGDGTQAGRTFVLAELDLTRRSAPFASMMAGESVEYTGAWGRPD